MQERLAILKTKQNNPETALKHAQTPNIKAKAYLQKGENEKAMEEIKAADSSPHVTSADRKAQKAASGAKSKWEHRTWKNTKGQRNVKYQTEQGQMTKDAKKWYRFVEAKCDGISNYQFFAVSFSLDPQDAGFMPFH